jgi:hypothetical protein
MFHVLPDSLLRALDTRQVLPVVGWGYPDFAPAPLLATAVSAVPRESPGPCGSRREVEKAALHWLSVAGPHVAPLYQAVAALPPGEGVIALTPDSRLPRTLEATSPRWVRLERDQAEYPPDRPRLLPLGGLDSDRQSMVLSGRDLLDLKRAQEILWGHAQSHAARLPLLVLGCDPADQATRRVLASLRPIPPLREAGWLVCGRAGLADRLAWEALGFQVVVGPLARLLREMVRRACDPAAQTVGQSRRARLASSPYKRLNYFERNEADLFFGRGQETDQLIHKVFAHRLVVVSGASGAGKTSLINAGLLAWADQASGEVGVYSRCENDPVAAIAQAVTRELVLEQGFKRSRETLTDFLARARDQRRVVPLIVLDQAEELFTRIGDALRDELVMALRDCLTVSPLAARFVLVLREDYLSRLAILRDRIPTVLQNVFLLRGLPREGALAAIRDPAAQVGVAFDDRLAEHILDDLGPGAAAPPQVQIICSRLFEEKRAARIDMELYERLGGAKAILCSYLADALRGLGCDETDARSVLKAMVTSEGTKDVLTAAEIARRARLPAERAGALLLHLRDQSRLLRGVQQEHEPCFELAHEYLTREIWTWMTPLDVTRREIEELLAREVRSWRRFRHLRLGLDRLRTLEANEALFEDEEDALILVLLSAVKHHRPGEAWIRRLVRLPLDSQDRAVSQLFDYFHNRDLIQRREAAEAVALLNPAPVIRALASPSAAHRKAALEMLAGIEEKSACTQIVRLLQDEDEEVRLLACAALGEIATRPAVNALLQAAAETDAILAAAAIAALGRSHGSPLLCRKGVIGRLAASAGQGRRYDSRAAKCIRQALPSSVPQRVAAAQKAVQSSRRPGLIHHLLRDRTLDVRARDRLWEAIDRAPRQVSLWVQDIVTALPPNDQEKAVKLFERHGTTANEALEQLSKSTGFAGDWAKGKLKAAQEREERLVNVRERVRAALGRSPSAAQYANLLAASDFDTRWATINELSQKVREGGATKRLFLALLRDTRPVVTAGAINALYHAPNDLGLLRPLLPGLLAHPDPTVRYVSCLAAAQHRHTEVVEHISRLIDNRDTAAWLYPTVGGTVADAAAHALDALHPSWKVWSKPTQVSFRNRTG